jgi:PRTRC genetic system protein E
MFKELVPILHSRAVLMTVTALDDDQIRVNVVPKKTKDGDHDALTTPLSVTGTAEELDTQLAATLVGFVASHLQMKNALEKAKSEMDAATKTAQAEARAKAKTPASKTPAKGEPTPAAVVAQSPEPAKPVPAKAASLFDVPAPVEDEDDSTSEGYTSEPEESEELDEAAWLPSAAGVLAFYPHVLHNRAPTSRRGRVPVPIHHCGVRAVRRNAPLPAV